MDQKQDQRSAIGGSSDKSTQPQYGFTPHALREELAQQSWDKFVTIAQVDGKTQVFTSERDQSSVNNLLKQSFPQMAGLETTG
jgi:hypothetical protein